MPRRGDGAPGTGVRRRRASIPRMRTALLPLAILGALTVAGCDKRNDDDIFHTDTAATQSDSDRLIATEIAALANGAKPEDPDASVAYDRAVNSLIKRGSGVETRIIDALRSNPDASIRLGCVEVLTAIGTKACVEHLIASLDDREPLVAWRAEITLRVLTKQRFIPEAGQPAKDGIPPVPARDPADVALDAESRTWAAWHAQNKVALKTAWQKWWTANRAGFTID